MSEQRPLKPGRRRGLAWLVAGLLVVAVVVVVTVAGGLHARAVPQRDVEPGTEMDAGNLVFRFTSATAQHSARMFGDPWAVVVTGEVRNPHDEALPLLSGSHTELVGVARPAMDNALNFQYELGAAGSDDAPSALRQLVPPGSGWVPLRVTFAFPDGFTPGDTFRVGVIVMEYSSNVVLGLSDEKTWHQDNLATPIVVRLPCTRLPDVSGG